MRRFRANKSKARQATSRMKLIEKIKVEDVKPSSRQYPYIRFEIDDRDKLHRFAVEVQKLAKGYDKPLFSNFNIRIEAGEKIAIIGPNGIGKTTLLRCLAGELGTRHRHRKWAEKARPAIARRTTPRNSPTTKRWPNGWARGKDPPTATRSCAPRSASCCSRATTRRNLTRVISGGEEQRMMFGKLMLQMPNVLLLDEPTNHLDMESIESLNTALDKYTGTLIFVSHDREFVSSLATRIIEMTAAGINIFAGNYEDYLAAQSLAA